MEKEKESTMKERKQAKLGVLSVVLLKLFRLSGGRKGDMHWLVSDILWTIISILVVLFVIFLRFADDLSIWLQDRRIRKAERKLKLGKK